MSRDEADQFVEMVSSAWNYPLTEMQKGMWRELVLPHEPHAAFAVIMRMFKTESRRPEPPIYLAAYRRRLVDSSPLHVAGVDRVEQPWWVRGWWVARNVYHDYRAWPEQKEGYERCGYRWDPDNVMPQEVRAGYMREAGAPL